MRLADRAVGAVLIAAAAVALPPARAELIEEIVAKVNDDIITRSEVDREEQALMAELYRRFAGEELDQMVKDARSGLLQEIIDRKLLIHRAERLYDIEKMQEVLLDEFMNREGIKNKEELERLLGQQGKTVEDLQRRLVEMMAPSEVIRFEVGNRLAVSDTEVDAYYETHSEEFEIRGEVTIREIVLLARDADKPKRRAEVDEIHERVTDGGEDFAEVAIEVSEVGTSEMGGLIGPFEKGDLVKAIEDAAFSIPVGTISPVLESENGFHIIKVEFRTDDGVRPLDEIREELRITLEDRKFEEALQDFLVKAREEANICVDPKYRSRFVLQVESSC